MKTEDLIGVLIVLTYGLMMLIEAIWPARPYPQRFLWRLKGWGLLVVMAVIGTAVPLLLPAAWLAEHRLMDLSGVGTVWGLVIGYAAFSLVAYGWHRASHRLGFLWRGLHQLHHAPQRLDMGGAALFHPLELVAYIGLSTVVSTLVLGLSPDAAAFTAFVAQFYSFFQHMNVRTPRWLGYLIQRPEAHFVHHQRDVHAFNYGDLPIWDVLFGTFRNPERFGEGEVGFDAPADQKTLAMLGFQDVSDSVGTQVQRSGPSRAVAA